MKKIKGMSVLLILALWMVAPSLAAAAEQLGVYVAPKFVYAYTQMKGLSGNWGNRGWGYYTGEADENDNAFGGALAVGYDFSKKFRVPVRTELEYGAFSRVEGKQENLHIYDDPDNWGLDEVKQKVGIQTLFVNAYYDFRNKTSFTPYLGAGIGLAFIRSNGRYNEYGVIYGSPFLRLTSLGSKTTTNFAWNVGGGLSYDITHYLSTEVGYRFVWLGGAKTKRSPCSYAPGNLLQARSEHLYMHQVTVGLRVTF